MHISQSQSRLFKSIPTSQSLPRVSKSIDITLVSSECIYVFFCISLYRLRVSMFIHTCPSYPRVSTSIHIRQYRPSVSTYIHISLSCPRVSTVIHIKSVLSEGT